jgi:hypothetical protein
MHKIDFNETYNKVILSSYKVTYKIKSKANSKER